MGCYLEAVDIHGTTQPQRCAFVNSMGESLSYGQLKAVSDSLAASIAACDDDGPARPIVVFGHKSPYMVACFLACSKSGHAYVPVDTAFPTSRVIDILDQLDAPLVLDTSMEGLGAAAAHASACIGIDELRCRGAQRLPVPDATCVVSGDDTCYILFTSGSTGKPKGVEVTAECVDNFWLWMKDEFGSGAGDVFFNRAPFSFDLSVTDLVLGLGLGATLFALERDVEESLADTFEALRTARVTFWTSTPSFADLCLRDHSFSQELFPTIKTFFFVGETLRNETAGKLLERFAGCTVVNGYGPTESTDLVASVCITSDMVAAAEPLPVGVARPGTDLFVLDPATLEPVGSGNPGELFIVGDTVAKGYFGRPEQTAAAFRSCPEAIAKGRRSYRTGDEVVLDDAGMLHFIGRYDFQVKLHGYRIELGDIEENLRLLPEVDDVCVLPVWRRESISHLAAYVIVDAPSRLRLDDDEFRFTQHLKNELGKVLPEYMVPRRFSYLEVFPLTSNGKLDRKVLQGVS